ncbi:hypothetical protein RBU49_16950 [Clostridium sp. MB40-C1]|uniref:hypothetical protein n=1 Tax=Clostridium sp. MB40-C1 TaxID=3070996 RepID=UPI0027DEDB48|nr:hypothetical protein [Clostridium sp. MB40-C1]WMJ80471.1 hypothetical protein RBU49_16950 [Clostridium sp. MB40-C1]
MFNSHIKKLRKIYSERMSYLNELIKNSYNSNIIWHVPNSGFFASFEITSGINTKDIIQRLNAKNILLENPKIFCLNNYINNNLLRLSISSVNNHEIKKGVSILLNEIY